MQQSIARPSNEGRSANMGTKAAKRPHLQIQAAALGHDATEILPYLYLGSDSLACDVDCLLQRNILYIVDCRVPARNFMTGSTDARCAQLQHLSLPITDEVSQGQAIKLDFVKSSRHIEAARRRGKACLVHCSAGNSALPNNALTVANTATALPTRALRHEIMFAACANAAVLTY